MGGYTVWLDLIRSLFSLSLFMLPLAGPLHNLWYGVLTSYLPFLLYPPSLPLSNTTSAAFSLQHIMPLLYSITLHKSDQLRRKGLASATDVKKKDTSILAAFGCQRLPNAPSVHYTLQLMVSRTMRPAAAYCGKQECIVATCAFGTLQTGSAHVPLRKSSACSTFLTELHLCANIAVCLSCTENT
jgi:hypothetical protein